MVVGVDTYHDSAKKGRSVGAFIASMNQTLTRYYSNCGFQSSHEELQNNLCTFMLGMYSKLSQKTSLTYKESHSNKLCGRLPQYAPIPCKLTLKVVSE